MNNEFLAHVIRDIFPIKDFTIIYGLNIDLREKLASSEHGIGAYILHTEREIDDVPEYCYYWEAGWNHPFFTEDSGDLLISIDYDPLIINDLYNNVAIQLGSVMKSGGLLFLINPGRWASTLEDFFIVREDLQKELSRFSFLSGKEIFVYENI